MARHYKDKFLYEILFANSWHGIKDKPLFPYHNKALRTRGPRGPWVAHLRKRSKVTVEPIIEIPRGII